MSGKSSFNILNVKDGTTEPIINAATSVNYAQTAFFFFQDNENPDQFEMHFTSTRKETVTKQTMYQNWYKMCFKSDFLEILKQNGYLPVSTRDQAL